MGTINKKLAEEIIAKDGHYFDDPRASKIVTYTSPEGDLNYAIIYPHEHQDRYHTSPWCLNTKIIWEAK